MNEVFKKETKKRKRNQKGKITKLGAIPEEEDAKSEELSADDHVNQTEIDLEKNGQGQNE